MPALGNSPSHASESTMDKKEEGGSGQVAAAATAHLPAIAEHDLDEGAKLAGEVATQFTEEEQNAVRRKIDRVIVPILAAVYFSQFLDKNSINYSSVMGLPITGLHYNLVTMAFYVGFLIFEMPQAALSQRFPIAKFLGVNMLLWSAALFLHAASGKWGVFFFFRVLLGAFECCVSPILIAIVAMWFKKDEQAKRIGSFYVCNGFTMIIGGALAFGVTKYEGPVSHWRVIYLILGAMALVVAIAVLVFLPDSPATARFLTERERLIALERVRANQSGTVSHRFKKDQAVEAVTDPKVWGLVLITAVICVPNAAITSFSSILIKSFGYTSQEALLMNMPGGAVAIATTATVSILADKKKLRMLPFLLSVIPSVVGMAILVAYSQNGDNKSHKGPLLAGILLSQTFVSGIALLYSWSASNIAGSTKKSLVNGMMLVAFGGGNLSGSQALASRDAPMYIPGKIALFVCLVLLVPGSLAMHYYVQRLNTKKAAEVARLVQENGWTEEDLQREKDKYAFADLTDRQNPFFTYIR
ncbi:hypothetical protein JCM6882_008469 [Rhodosporidiobolus microsporus]